MRPGVRTRAPAKINVCLFVGGVRPSDGRHTVVSVMQAVDLCDELTLTAADRDVVRCDGVTGPNLAGAARDAFRAHTGHEAPVAITITKAIPVAAGMAGGSADAGAVLRLLDEHFATALGDDVLRELATALGADVPAQVRPGRHLATGAGELVRAVDGPSPYGVVVIAHPEPLSTPAVFREFDRLHLARSDEELGALDARVRAVAHDLPDTLVVNDLQPAAISLCPAIGENLRRLSAAGVDLALVSGSGPTVVGLTRTVAAAHDVARRVGTDAGVTVPLTDAAKVVPA